MRETTPDTRDVKGQWWGGVIPEGFTKVERKEEDPSQGHS